MLKLRTEFFIERGRVTASLLLYFKTYAICKIYFCFVILKSVVDVRLIFDILRMLSNIIEILLTMSIFGDMILSNRKEDSL